MRITVVEWSIESATLRVEGKLAGRWVEELRRSCNLHSRSGATRLILNLSDISFVDASGIELLKELRDRRVILLSPSPFVASHLNKPATSSSPEDSARRTRPAKLVRRIRSSNENT